MELASCLVVQGESRLSRQPLSVKAKMGTGREVVTMVTGVWVVVVGGIGDGEEIFGDDHAAGDAGTEVLDLAADVPKESIAGPSANEHDGVNWDIGQVHSHGCGGTDGVKADCVC